MTTWTCPRCNNSNPELLHTCLKCAGPNPDGVSRTEYEAMWQIVMSSCCGADCKHWQSEYADCAGNPGVCPRVREAMK